MYKYIYIHTTVIMYINNLVRNCDFLGQNRIKVCNRDTPIKYHVLQATTFYTDGFFGNSPYLFPSPLPTKRFQVENHLT